MGRFFSDKVEQALQCIYYNLAAGRGQEGFKLLQEACAEGDADAYCLLARCLYGSQYTWVGHGFPVDEEEGDRLMREAVLHGSAIGTLIAMRCGVMDDELKEAMPFDSLEDAFELVLAEAERGDAFCQMLIGNVYYWCDFLDIKELDSDNFESDDDFRAYARENILKCEDWYTKALDGGVATAGANLYLLYQDGKYDLIAPQPEKARELNRRYAAKGYPNYQYLYACDLYDDGKLDEAFELFRKAAAAGEPRAYFFAGWSYELGNGVKQDYARAAEFYKKGIAANLERKEGLYNQLGALYFNGNGVEQDYNEAFRLIKMADDCGTTGNWGAYYLGYCYAYGRGTETDFTLARKYLESIDWDCPDAFFLLGWLYCNGEGGPEDIEKGIEYLHKAGDCPEVREELSHYKKNLFGKWVRRDAFGSSFKGMFSFLSAKKPEAPKLPQPHADWRWTLKTGDTVIPNPTPRQIKDILYALTPNPDSFVILEQLNPVNKNDYWFLQCAIALKGELKGQYVAEIGFTKSDYTPQLWQRAFKDVQSVAEYFYAAYHRRKPLDFTGFTEAGL